MPTTSLTTVIDTSSGSTMLETAGVASPARSPAAPVTVALAAPVALVVLADSPGIVGWRIAAQKNGTTNRDLANTGVKVAAERAQ